MYEETLILGVMNAGQCAAAIQANRSIIDRAYATIRDIAKEHIPDFHFLDYEVSTFWECDKSPIGMCVFKREYEPHIHLTVCRYCGGPVERKVMASLLIPTGNVHYVYLRRPVGVRRRLWKLHSEHASHRHAAPSSSGESLMVSAGSRRGIKPDHDRERGNHGGRIALA